MMKKQDIASGTILYGGYVIERVLGEGGFGITYLAHRQETGEKVAVKEYFPSQFAVRKNNSCELHVADRDMEEYDRGRARFMKEASILKEFRYLQGIVKVWDCFETNCTAYIIMDYIDGVTLKEYIASHGSMEYQELMEMLSPILKSLVTLHRHGVIHRDISPDNLMIGMDNSLYLIDFGSAKEMEYGRTTTVLLKAGYAPPEQYLHDGELGAWTDVYALCATIYTALCGKAPADAVARLQGKELVPLSVYGVVLEDWQWNAISKGMRMRSAERFRDVGALYDALAVAPTQEDIATIVEPEIDPFLRDKMEHLNASEKPKSEKKKKGVILSGVVVLLLILLAVGVVYGNSRWTAKPETQQNQNSDLTDEGNDVQNNISSDAVQEEEHTTSEESQPKLCQMPDVAGLDKEAAIARISSADAVIKISIVREYSNAVEQDVVIEQNVAPDTRYNEGAIKEIVLTVSDGVKPAATTSTKTSKSDNKQDSYDVKSDGNESVDFYLDN